MWILGLKGLKLLLAHFAAVATLIDCGTFFVE